LYSIRIYSMTISKAFIILIILTLPVGWSFGQTDDLRKKHFNSKQGLVLEGFDPVSYFDGNPLEGSPKIKILYKGLTYHFASQTNLDKFRSSPEKFEPAYGGWCAFAMGETGEKVKIDPETYKILDGKLFLFYNFWGNNTLREWNKTEKKLKETADRNWKETMR
jgi:YHS domain-containing protein